MYCQVPNGWRADHTAAIEAQIDRFAPGFRDLILARTITTPAAAEARNPNNKGGDIAEGRCDQFRLLFRPTFAPVPYATPNRAIYLCSAATPPGPGTHGMCGYHAAAAALRRVFGRRLHQNPMTQHPKTQHPVTEGAVPPVAASAAAFHGRPGPSRPVPGRPGRG